MMEFDLISFTLVPTNEVFNRCKKSELLMIADFFRFNVPREATRKVIKEERYDKLVNEGILPRQSGDSGEVEHLEVTAGKELDSVDPPNTDTMAVQDPRLAVRLKELDLEIKKQECEAQMLILRTIEAEADRDIKL